LKLVVQSKLLDDEQSKKKLEPLKQAPPKIPAPRPACNCPPGDPLCSCL
jgi:hypothetical protein